MNLDLAIERQRKPLARIVATLFAMIGLAAGNHVERLSLPVYRAVLRLLRPAESAVRRLIVVASRGLTPTPPRPCSTPRAKGTTRTSRKCRVTFRLFDPRQRFGSAFGHHRRRIRVANRPEPRLRVIDVGFDPRMPLFRRAASAMPEPTPTPIPDGTVNATRLSRRLIAIKLALEDLPRQARRYVRWQARPPAERRPQLSSALRPGRPPGFRKNPIHKVDKILAECDWLARHPPQPDTS